VSISDGDIVFDGDVTVTAGPPGNPTRFSILNSPSTPGWAFFRDGVLDKGGRAHLTFDQTMVYFSRTSSITMAGNTVGTLTWVGPDTGDFDDLALWSDSAITHAWAGQALLTMEGVFFTPWATATYTGNGIQQQTDAQWVAHRLQVSGNGVLTITPKFEFPVKVDGTPRTILIR
jgi:hypothetical protein